MKAIDAYTLNCDNCGKPYYSKEGFPNPQLCPSCSSAYSLGIKEVVEWIQKEYGLLHPRGSNGQKKWRAKLKEWGINEASSD